MTFLGSSGRRSLYNTGPLTYFDKTPSLSLCSTGPWACAALAAHPTLFPQSGLCASRAGREMGRIKKQVKRGRKKKNQRGVHSRGFYQLHSSTHCYIQTRCRSTRVERRTDGMGREVRLVGEERLSGRNVVRVKQREEMVARELSGQITGWSL